MSRYYRVCVECIGKITTEELISSMHELGWCEEMDTWDSMKSISLTAEGRLCGGKSEDEAHEEIVKKLRVVCPNCGDDDLEFFTMEPDDNLMLQDVECRKCEHTFTIWSSMKFYYDLPEDDDMAPSVVEIKK